MKLEQFTISNFRNAKAVTIACGSCHALVGGNNAGKSTLLRALDLFFNPSKRRISEESFWNKDTTKEIRVEGIFGKLSADEQAKLKPYLRADGRFQLARTVKWKGEDAATQQDDDDDEAKCEILTAFCRPEPKFPWLRESEINGKTIKEWWANKDSLVANNQAFTSVAGSSCPSVGGWKEKAAEFAAKYLKPEDYEDSWSPNPQGFSNVLKGTLPMFVFVPAVRDIQDESKGTSASPFGKMLRAIIESVPKEKKKELEDSLTQIKQALNRGGSRLPAVTNAENQLNENLRKIFANCDLEIEFQTPDFTYLLASPKLLVNDGYRGGIENKGHGLQRAAIFAILQSFATQTATTGVGTRRTLIFAVEEPELYMHPQAQRTIRRVFKDVAKTDQVFFSTHSSFMVDVAFFDEIIRVESRSAKVSETSNCVESFVFQVKMADMILDLETRHPAVKGKTTADSFRDLYSHAYNPTRNEGFFASRVILTEGNTEEYALPIYSEACGYRFDKDSVSVVSCGGKESIDRLYRVFNELGISCFVVLDYDDGGSAEAVSSSKQLLDWLEHPNGVPNKILLTDKVACFQKDWEQTCAAEVADYAALKQEARKFLGVKEDNGKPLIARYIARVLVARNPAVVPPTIAAVLSKAIGCKHTGSCLRKPA